MARQMSTSPSRSRTGSTADAARVHGDLMPAADQLPGLTPRLPFGTALDRPVQAQTDADPQSLTVRVAVSR